MARFNSKDLRGDNTIDTRDLLERISYLEDEEDAATEENPMDEDEASELTELLECKDDLPLDETLIRESYFEKYAQETMEDIEGIDPKSFIWSYIDWERLAEDLKVDYTTIEIGDYTYYYRS